MTALSAFMKRVLPTKWQEHLKRVLPPRWLDTFKRVLSPKWLARMSFQLESKRRESWGGRARNRSPVRHFRAPRKIAASLDLCESDA